MNIFLSDIPSNPQTPSTEQTEEENTEDNQPNTELELICTLNVAATQSLPVKTQFIPLPGVSAAVQFTLMGNEFFTLTIHRTKVAYVSDDTHNNSAHIHSEDLIGSASELQDSEVLVVAFKKIAQQKPNMWANMLFPLMMMFTSWMQRRMLKQFQDQQGQNRPQNNPQLRPRTQQVSHVEEIDEEEEESEEEKEEKEKEEEEKEEKEKEEEEEEKNIKGKKESQTAQKVAPPPPPKKQNNTQQKTRKGARKDE